MFRQRTAREVLAQCVAAALAVKECGDLTLSAVEVRLRALQKEQMGLLQIAMREGVECTEYDDRISQINAAMSALLARKAELVQGEI